MMKSSVLFQKFPEISGIGNIEISYIQSDTRKILPGDIFCMNDRFIDKAVTYAKFARERGAGAILCSEKTASLFSSKDDLLISAVDPALLHGPIASFFCGNPSSRLNITAVTGTNGKTSITHILADLFSFAGKRCGIIGTIAAKFNGKVIDCGLTTPEPSTMHRLLQQMAEEGIEYVFMEASSHGLKLGRLEGLEFNAGIFTNLTPDHMDFHPDIEDYLLSKFHLFELIEKSPKKEKFAVISSDSAGSADILKLFSERNISYPVIQFGKDKEAEGFLKSLDLQGTSFDFKFRERKFSFQSHLLGVYNFINVSLSLCVFLQSEKDSSDSSTVQSVLSLKSVEGRFQIVPDRKRKRIGIVDYAHSPDALENILSSMREIPNSKLITVFGCGGDRDRTKRPMMGKVSASYSDFVILTSDNPRTEDPEFILSEIEKGIPAEFKNWKKISDRREAIREAVKMLPENGLLLVAGKGHENYQIIGKEKFHFLDSEEIDKAFSEE